jgi:N-methylhydantoinase A
MSEMQEAGRTAGRTKLAADIGGTFTDVVLEAAGQRYSTKVLTDHEEPQRGIMAGVGIVLAEANIPASSVDLLIHGTTLATNAIIERRGAHTALVTTEGFRDVLEMAYEHRFDQYDVFIDKPAPLVRRNLRFAVSERMDAKGRVRLPLDEAALRRVAEDLRRERIESVAICFLHSYINGAHERRAAEILGSLLPDLRITLSCEVCPEIREYERFTTASANAYVQPLIAGYLEGLRAAMEESGLSCPLLLMTSGGGLAAIETAIKFPIKLVESGPAGGVIFAKNIAAELGLSKIVAFDMGGTTAKVCLVDDGEAMVSRSFEIDRRYFFQKGSGLPLRTPVVDMVEIGAGGGSISGLDALARVAVGPQSAGSVPGPACYDRGGSEATVTDANLVLGRIDPKHFAGGRIPLNESAGRDAIRVAVGAPLHLSHEFAAFAISETVEENMANAARLHATERGLELFDRTLIALGGSAPLHVARLAEKLGIDDVVIPANAGVGSAVGFLRAPVSFHSVRTLLVRLSALDPDAVAGIFAEMEAEATAIVRLGLPEMPIRVVHSAEMRYVGQGHQISVSLPDEPIGPRFSARLRELFEEQYKQLFGRIIANYEIEVTSWLLLAIAEPRATAPSGLPVVPSERPKSTRSRRLFNHVASDYRDVPVYERTNLEIGHMIAGPAIIVEDETSTIVTDAFSAAIDAGGAIRLRRKSPKQEAAA